MSVMRNMRVLLAVAFTAAVMLVSSAAAAHAGGHQRNPASIDLQNKFDHIGAEVHSLTQGGRTSYYIDEGKPGQRAVVFMGGQGTSLEAFQLSEFARSSREELGLRVISVERNGFGESELDLDLRYPDYNAEVLAVLDHLGINRFAILGISGGGAYAAHLAAAVPNRVISLHAAAATSSTLPTRAPRDCTPTFEQRNVSNLFWYENPKIWWGIAPGSPVLAVPGWQDTAYNDAVRSFHLGGGPVDPSPLSHEARLPCLDNPFADTDAITSPAYMYWGGADTTVPVAVLGHWQAALPNIVKTKIYPGEGHTVQYRHWDQILVDMAGYGDHTVICRNRRTKLVRNNLADWLVERGAATLGLCAWTAAP